MQETTYPNIFETGKIGNRTTKNRLVMPPMGTNLASREGNVTDRLVEYYRERARGGVGTIIVEVAAVDPGGRAIPNQIGIWSDEFVPGLTRLASAIKKYSALAVIQLHHAGRQTNSGITGAQPVAPSPIPCPVNQEIPKELSTGEIEGLVQAFGEAAKRAVKSGFDAVELHGTHGYLINQFMSPYSNHRNDEYGGTLQGRMKFPLDIIRLVMENIGDQHPVLFRINGNEYVENGITLDMAKTMAVQLTEAGISALHVSAGVYGSPAPNVPITGTTPAPLLYLAEGIKKVSPVPVIAVAKIHEPRLAESILAENKADFISMGRALITDPYLPEKLKTRSESSIRTCICCNQGCIDPMLAEGKQATCIYNPRAGREIQYPEVPAQTKKKVMVIGAGPAGLETARTAAQRGHDVHLYELTGNIGGQVLLASATPHKREFAEIVTFYKNEISRLGINVQLNRNVDVNLITQVKPDAVIIATGASPLVADIPGADGERVYQAWDIISTQKEPGKNGGIVGGGLVGCETAELLAEKGCRVTVVEMLDEIAHDGSVSLRTALLERLMNNPKIKIVTGAKVEKITDDSLIVQKQQGREEIKGLDFMVLAAGARPNNKLVDEIKAAGFEVHVIGDALEPRKILDAVHQGFETAYGL